MSAKYVGAHVPTGKGLGSAIREAHRIGCTAVQVFTSSPRMWKGSSPSPEKILEFKKAVADTGINELISHDTYLVNLCHPEEEIATKSRETLRDEMVRCGTYGIGKVVSHIGSLKGQILEDVLAPTAAMINEILAETPDSVTLCMETTAGQGSSLNSKFEEMAKLLDACGDAPRLGVCMDTCHIFAAGYDIRTFEDYEAIMAWFDHLIGIDRLKAFHFNDSKKGLGSHVDRHDNIGKGMIGVEPFGFFVNDPRLENIMMVVETPTENEGHERDIATLRGLMKT